MINKIKIGCFDYKIKVTNKPIIVNKELCHGSIDYYDRIIEISSDLDIQSQEVVLWHEIVHGIFDYRHLKPGVIEDEDLVEEIALGLYSIAKNNGILPGQKVK